MQSQADKEIQLQTKRYSKYLNLTYEDYGNKKIYSNLPQTLKVLRQIYELSKNQQGRKKLHKIQSSLISYYFVDSIKIWWSRQGYWEVDNLILKIVANLALDQIFFKQVCQMQTVLQDLIPQCYSKNFQKLGNQALKNISALKQNNKKNRSVKYKKQFKNKQEAIQELNNHEDFFNFAGGSPFYKQQYTQYVEMLRGALKAGARQKVTYSFPKRCFGCVLFSMVMTGYQTGKKQVAMKFLQDYTNGWMTQFFYDYILSQMRVLYNHLNRNQNLTDRYQLVCLRFSSCKQTQYLYEYLSSLYSKNQKQQISKEKKITSRYIIQNKLNKLKTKQKIKQEIYAIRRQYKTINRKSKQYFDVSKILVPAQSSIILNQIYKNLQQNQNKLSKINLCLQTQNIFQKYNLQEIKECNSYEIYVIKLENHKLLIIYFLSPSTYYKRKGQINLFQIKQICNQNNQKNYIINKCYLGQLKQKRFQKVQKLNKQNKNKKQRKFFDKEDFDEDYYYYKRNFMRQQQYEDQLISSEQQKQQQKSKQYNFELTLQIKQTNVKIQFNMVQQNNTAILFKEFISKFKQVNCEKKQKCSNIMNENKIQAQNQKQKEQKVVDKINEKQNDKNVAKQQTNINTKLQKLSLKQKQSLKITEIQIYNLDVQKIEQK